MSFRGTLSTHSSVRGPGEEGKSEPRWWGVFVEKRDIVTGEVGADWTTPQTAESFEERRDWVGAEVHRTEWSEEEEPREMTGKEWKGWRFKTPQGRGHDPGVEERGPSQVPSCTYDGDTSCESFKSTETRVSVLVDDVHERGTHNPYRRGKPQRFWCEE